MGHRQRSSALGMAGRSLGHRGSRGRQVLLRLLAAWRRRRRGTRAGLRGHSGSRPFRDGRIHCLDGRRCSRRVPLRCQCAAGVAGLLSAAGLDCRRGRGRWPRVCRLASWWQAIRRRSAARPMVGHAARQPGGGLGGHGRWDDGGHGCRRIRRGCTAGPCGAGRECVCRGQVCRFGRGGRGEDRCRFDAARFSVLRAATARCWRDTGQRRCFWHGVPSRGMPSRGIPIRGIPSRVLAWPLRRPTLQHQRRGCRIWCRWGWTDVGIGSQGDRAWQYMRCVTRAGARWPKGRGRGEFDNRRPGVRRHGTGHRPALRRCGSRGSGRHARCQQGLSRKLGQILEQTLG